MAETARRITRLATVDLADLSDSEQSELGEKLYEVHCRVFSGVSEEQFTSHVITPPAAKTVIRLYIAENEELAGYCAVHTFKRRLRGRNILVLRAEAGLRPEYRGRGSTYWFGMVRAVAEKLRHPFVPVYYLGTLVHTSSYHLFCKYFPVVFPHPFGNNQPGLREDAVEMIEGFSDPAVHSSDSLVRDVGWVTIESPQEQELGRFENYADVAFFKERNPGYRKGHGLVTVVPMTFSNLARALAARISEVISTRLGRPHNDL